MRTTITLNRRPGRSGGDPALGRAAPQAAQTVRITETDCRIVLSKRPRAGTVVFVIRNDGDDPRGFRLRGGGVVRKTRMLAPGETARLRVVLSAASATALVCAAGGQGHAGLVRGAPSRAH